ncbi:xanthine dehydrogenase family protein subunit M [Candidatus Thiothrix sp. Deng01]|uniref:Xanthine dehydrogenase family protein subunit M n=1 Tax=Candidatus Thiothrix phosphatis TaxID=3112415 RepID=A0ABU6D2C8_9GAMM|nr:xanthine dehydrogenase family protein subunit M [Candidatus Thiothrix sp. Deng01]MEB4593244.1 xanthine dehydrogenase family protein subunit M [Candidatus Thiothrix sp. Deng01]
MIPSGFEYHAPSSVNDALKLLAEHDNAKILAGGHSLLPMMKLRFAEPDHLVDLNGVAELKGIRLDGDTICIGAMTTESELIASEVLREHCPLIVDVAKLIADPQVRNKGTIGGDIAHGDPGNDHPALMLALDAELLIRNSQADRVVPAADFFLGTYWTALEEGEILTEIRVPVFQPHTGYGYNKLKRKTGDFATAASPVVLTLDGDSCRDIRIGLTNVAPMAIRATAAEDLLRGQVITDSLIEQAAEKVMAACEPVEDLRGDVEYKTHMAAEMARRSMRDALERARS